MGKSERRPQASKNSDRVTRVQGIRSSGAAGIHSGQGEYQRMDRGQLDRFVWQELVDEWDGSYSNEW